MPDADDDFEEVRALKAELAARHRRLVAALLVAGGALLAGAGAVYALVDLERRPGLLIVPVGLLSFGLAVVGRALYSRFTDVDTRARDDEIVGVAPLAPERAEEERP